MKNGAPLAMLAVMSIMGLTAIQAAMEPSKGSRNAARFRDMSEIKNANLEADGVFFRPDSMEIFGTHLEAGPFQGRFFVTSEQFTSMRGKTYARRFTVREAMPNGAIGTVGEFQQHRTKDEAVKAAKEAS